MGDESPVAEFEKMREPSLLMGSNDGTRVEKSTFSLEPEEHSAKRSDFVVIQNSTVVQSDEKRHCSDSTQREKCAFIVQSEEDAFSRNSTGVENSASVVLSEEWKQGTECNNSFGVEKSVTVVQPEKETQDADLCQHLEPSLLADTSQHNNTAASDTLLSDSVDHVQTLDSDHEDWSEGDSLVIDLSLSETDLTKQNTAIVQNEKSTAVKASGKLLQMQSVCEISEPTNLNCDTGTQESLHKKTKVEDESSESDSDVISLCEDEIPANEPADFVITNVCSLSNEVEACENEHHNTWDVPAQHSDTADFAITRVCSLSDIYHKEKCNQSDAVMQETGCEENVIIPPSLHDNGPSSSNKVVEAQHITGSLTDPSSRNGAKQYHAETVSQTAVSTDPHPVALDFQELNQQNATEFQMTGKWVQNKLTTLSSAAELLQAVSTLAAAEKAVQRGDTQSAVASHSSCQESAAETAVRDTLADGRLLECSESQPHSTEENLHTNPCSHSDTEASSTPFESVYVERASPPSTDTSVDQFISTASLTQLEGTSPSSSGAEINPFTPPVPSTGMSGGHSGDKWVKSEPEDAGYETRQSTPSNSMKTPESAVINTKLSSSVKRPSPGSFRNAAKLPRTSDEFLSREKKKEKLDEVLNISPANTEGQASPERIRPQSANIVPNTSEQSPTPVKISRILANSTSALSWIRSIDHVEHSSVKRKASLPRPTRSITVPLNQNTGRIVQPVISSVNIGSAQLQSGTLAGTRTGQPGNLSAGTRCVQSDASSASSGSIQPTISSGSSKSSQPGTSSVGSRTRSVLPTIPDQCLANTDAAVLGTATAVTSAEQIADSSTKIASAKLSLPTTSIVADNGGSDVKGTCARSDSVKEPCAKSDDGVIVKTCASSDGGVKGPSSHHTTALAGTKSLNDKMMSHLHGIQGKPGSQQVLRIPMADGTIHTVKVIFAPPPQQPASTTATTSTASSQSGPASVASIISSTALQQVTVTSSSSRAVPISVSNAVIIPSSLLITALTSGAKTSARTVKAKLPQNLAANKSKSILSTKSSPVAEPGKRKKSRSSSTEGSKRKKPDVSGDGKISSADMARLIQGVFTQLKYQASRDCPGSDAPPPVYRCTECGDSFATTTGFSSHINRMSMVIRYACMTCETVMVFFNKCTFLAHLRLHASVEQQEGSVLNLRSYTMSVSCLPEALLPPADIHRMDPLVVNRRDPVNCPECNITLSSTSQGLAQHFGSTITQWQADNKCSVCNMDLPTACSLKAHLRLHGGTKTIAALPPYVCPDCGLSFPNHLSLYQHLYATCLHFCRTVALRCALCTFSAASRRVLEMHISQRHKEVIETCLRCPVCNLDMKMTEDCEKHMSGHIDKMVASPRFSYACHYCKQPHKEGSLEDLIRHLTHTHAAYRYRCALCGLGFVSVAVLRAHVLVEHKGNTRIQCRTCLCNILLPAAALPHAMWHIMKDIAEGYLKGENDRTLMDILLTGPEDKRQSLLFFCRVCGEAHSTPGELLVHVNSHKIWGIRVCPVCQRSDFSSRREAMIHRAECSPFPSEMLRQTQLMQFRGEAVAGSREVETCVLENTGQSEPQENSCTQSDSGEKIAGEQQYHPCHLCGLTYETKETLMEHYASVHSGQKNVYFCLVCRKRGKDRSFSKRQMLVSHCVRKHRVSPQEAESMIKNEAVRPPVQNTGEVYPVPAPVQSPQLPPPSSPVKSPVKRLRVAHDEQQEFVCAKCMFSATNRDEFQNHISQHKVDSSVQCLECGLCFTAIPSLKKHLFMVHRIKQPQDYIDKHGIAVQELEEEVLSHLNQFAPLGEEEHEFVINVHRATAFPEEPLPSPQYKQEPVDKPKPSGSGNPFECTVCYREFAEEHQLKAHMRTHGMAFIRSRRTNTRGSVSEQERT